jgi:mannose-6-phosphate isomerase-like protein (cupin superfamily)
MTRPLALAFVVALGLVPLPPAPVGSAAVHAAVAYIPADRVSAAFLKGMPLLEVANYKIHASRRAGAGQVEVHTKDTDIIHVLTGSATFVTGGDVAGGKETAPEEIRGTSIERGDVRTIRAGDVIVVPNGTPHWFKEVPAPMTYYVVKVRAEEVR